MIQYDNDNRAVPAGMEHVPVSGTVQLKTVRHKLTPKQAKRMERIERIRAAAKAAEALAKRETEELANEIVGNGAEGMQIECVTEDNSKSELRYGVIKHVPQTRKWIPATEGHWTLNKDKDHYRTYLSKSGKLNSSAVKKALKEIELTIG